MADDLLEFFRKDTTFYPLYVEHTTHRRDRVERWQYATGIGMGGSGIVNLQQELNSKRHRAVKTIRYRDRKRSELREEILQEVKIMAILAKYDDLFVKIQGWFEEETFVHVAMEYFEYGDLARCVRGLDHVLPEHDAKTIAYQLLEGLQIMHRFKIVHRDIKPQNIMVASKDPWRIKIGDFGISIRDGRPDSSMVIGTKAYMPPEAFFDETPACPESRDIWGVGITICGLLCYEFSRKLDMSPYRMPKVDMSKMIEQKLHGVSEEAIDLMKRLCAIEPWERPTAADALRAKWFESGIEAIHSRTLSDSETIQLQSAARLTDSLAVQLGVPSAATSSVNIAPTSRQQISTGELPTTRSSEDATARFQKAMSQFKSLHADPTGESTLQLEQTQNWDEVLALAEQRRDRYRSRAQRIRGLLTKIGRKTGDVIPDIDPVLQCLPQGDYTAAVFGGIKLILKAAGRMGEVRQSIFNSLQEAAEYLDTAEAFIQLYPKDEDLIDVTVELYVTILTALEGILVWFDHGPKDRFKVLLQQGYYGKDLDKKISDVASGAAKVRNQAQMSMMKNGRQIMDELSILSGSVDAIKDLQAKCLSVTLDTSRTVQAMERRLADQDKKLADQERTCRIILDQLTALDITSHWQIT